MNSASAIASPASSAVTALARPLAALVRALVSSVAAPTTLASSSSTRRSSVGECLLGDVELRQPFARLARPTAAHRRCRRRTCGSACAARPAGPAWFPKCLRRWAIRPDSRRVRSRRQRSRPAHRRAARPAPAAPSRRWPPAPTSPVRRRRWPPIASGRRIVVQTRTARRAPSARPRAARRVRTAGGSRRPARRPRRVPVRRRRSRRARTSAGRLPAPARAPVGCGRPGRDGPAASRRAAAIALQLRLDVDEPVKRRALLVGPHQPQLVVLAVQRKQFGGERAQRLGGHAAAAEVGARRPVAADRPRGDDAAVVVAVGARGIEDLVDPGGHAVAEFGCGETAFDDRAVGAGAHPGGVGAGPAEQVQARHDHRLARAGLAGQHGQPAVELGGRGADRAQRLDTDLGEHYCPRHPVTGNRNLRTRRSVNGALSSRTHLQRRAAARHLEPATRGHHHLAAAVAEHHRVVAVGLDLDRDGGVRAGHHRPGEQRVSVVGHHQDRLEVGPQDRAAGRERVRGRPGRRRDQHAVAAERRDRPAVDLEHHAEHAEPRPLLQAGLVQRPAAVDRPRRRRAPTTSSVMRSSTR